jgi:hypothetical protein
MWETNIFAFILLGEGEFYGVWFPFAPENEKFYGCKALDAFHIASCTLILTSPSVLHFVSTNSALVT